METPTDYQANIEALNDKGQGVAHRDGKALFIDGALPGERVTYESYRKKPRFECARTLHIEEVSFIRTQPLCPHFGVCGGCSLQHIDSTAQVAAKQRVLEEQLRHIGGVTAATLLPAVQGPSWAYRYRARFSARFVRKKETVLLGFHERRSSFIADMRQCPILSPQISKQLLALRALVSALSIYQAMPQIEVAMGENGIALVFRILDRLTTNDYALLQAYASAWDVQIWLQPSASDSAFLFYPKGASPLRYTLPEFEVVIEFHPTAFTQVNPFVNRTMVRCAMQLLDPRPGERVVDFFCGLGNFTLPIARLGAQVLGIEGKASSVRAFLDNARNNLLADRVTAQVADLLTVDPAQIAALGSIDKILLDPPRDGAFALCQAIAAKRPPRRIVYISCNPATLARDANVLVNVHGYTLQSAGVINLFPHTTHVESIACFEKGPS